MDRLQLLGAPFLSVGLLVLAACESTAPVAPSCPEIDAGTTADVSGTFRYSSPLFLLRGTIVFEQTGSTVHVVDTTYDNADDRRLEGEAKLVGNRLDIVLVPINGDTDYSARVDFAFSASGDSFCVVGFTDTNGDEGGQGSYSGVRMQ